MESAVENEPHVVVWRIRDEFLREFQIGELDSRLMVHLVEFDFGRRIPSAEIFRNAPFEERPQCEHVAFGGGCVNNASWHLTNHNLPFGGRGYSGTGSYHGKFSFDTFSHKKGIMKTPTWFDPSIKYPPYKGKLKLFKMIIGK